MLIDLFHYYPLLGIFSLHRTLPSIDCATPVEVATSSVDADILMARQGYIGGVMAVLSLMLALLFTAACSQPAAAPPLQQASVSPTPTSEALPKRPSPTVVVDIPTSEPAPTPTTIVRSTPTLQSAPSIVEGGRSLAPDGGFFLELLEFVPDRPETRGLLWMQDFGPWWSGLEGFGVERPGPDAPADRLIDDMYAIPLTALFRSIPWVQTPLVCCPTEYLSSNKPYPYVGFDFRNADRTLKIERGKFAYEVALGVYDTDVTAARLGACDECIEHELVEYGGTTYYAWGEDFQGGIRQRFSPPLFDQAGRGGRLSVGEGYVMRSLHDEGIEGMIDAKNGDVRSLADSDDYQLAVGALMGVDAYAAGIVSAGLSLEDFRQDCLCNTREISIEDRIQAATSLPLLKPFTAAAAGYVLDGPNGPAHSVLVLVHEDEESAMVNAERLVERLQIEYATAPNVFPSANWGDNLDHIEIAVDGKVIMAKLFRVDDASESYIYLPSILWPGGALMYD